MVVGLGTISYLCTNYGETGLHINYAVGLLVIRLLSVLPAKM